MVLFKPRIEYVEKETFKKSEKVLLEADRRVLETQDYDIFDIDLSIPHTDEPIGIAKLGVVGTSLTIEEAPNEYRYKVNSPGNKPFLALQGKQYVGNIYELYITNPGTSGIGRILVAWDIKSIKRDELLELEAIKVPEKPPEKIVFVEREKESPWVTWGRPLLASGLAGLFVAAMLRRR